MFDSVILAGGKASRMGGNDKGLITFNGKYLIDYPINLLKNYHTNIVISANRNVDFYHQYTTTITDENNNFDGPLAGIYAALKYFKSSNTKYLLVMPIDTPLLTTQCIDRLLDINDYEINVAFDGERIHPTILVIKQDLITSIKDFLKSGERKLGKWIRNHNYQKVFIEEQYLKNINYPKDLLTPS